MKLAEAKELVLGLILAEQPEIARLLAVAPVSPDGGGGPPRTRRRLMGPDPEPGSQRARAITSSFSRQSEY